MAESSFDVSIHLGPGVTAINSSSHNSKHSVQNEDIDPNKDEVHCSCRLMFGMFFAIFVVLALAVILVLYLLCQLSYQVDEACWYKEHRLPNISRQNDVPLD